MCYPFLPKRPHICRYKLCLFLVDFLPFIYFGEKPNKMFQLSTIDTHHELGAHTPEPEEPGFQFSFCHYWLYYPEKLCNISAPQFPDLQMGITIVHPL